MEIRQKKRLLLVMNPCAGVRRANRYLSNIASLFMKYGYEALLCMTEKRGDATAFVLSHVREVELVVAVGGDGTFNEVLAGLLQSGVACPLGYIPAGSTNDFGAGLGLSKNILRAAEDIVRGTPRPLDVGLFGDRYFSYVASCGAFTKVSYATPQNVKNALGHLAYVLEGIRDLGSLRPRHVRFETENAVFDDEYIFGAISNSTSVGGVLSLAPDVVDMNDGRFELLLIRAPHNLGELNECIRALTTKEYDAAMITLASAAQVTVTAPEDMDWTLDGEFARGQETIVVRNLHNAIHLLMRENTADRAADTETE